MCGASALFPAVGASRIQGAVLLENAKGSACASSNSASNTPCTCWVCKAPALILLHAGAKHLQCMAMPAQDAPFLLQRRQCAALPQQAGLKRLCHCLQARADPIPAALPAVQCLAAAQLKDLEKVLKRLCPCLQAGRAGVVAAQCGHAGHRDNHLHGHHYPHLLPHPLLWVSV